MSELAIQALNGVSLGCVLFLLAAGLSLIYGLMGFLNLAHGSYFMFAAYVGVAIARTTGNLLLAIVAGGATIAVMGIVMERLLFRHLYKEPVSQVLLTLGLLFIFGDVVKWIWGGYPYSVAPPAFLTGFTDILGRNYPVYRLAVIIAGLSVALLLWLFLEKTLFGAIIRAGVDDKEMVTGLGINIKFFFTVIFGLGSFLAGFGGVMATPIMGAYLGMDGEVLLLALVVVVVGGLGTLGGALLGSMVISITYVLAAAFIPEVSMFIMFATMALILIVRPSGLMGKKRSI